MLLLHLSRVGSWWQRVKRQISEVLCLSKAFQLLLGAPSVFPGQEGYIIPTATSGTSHMNVPIRPQKGGAQEASLSDPPTTSNCSFIIVFSETNIPPRTSKHSDIVVLKRSLRRTRLMVGGHLPRLVGLRQMAKKYRQNIIRLRKMIVEFCTRH